MSSKKEPLISWVPVAGIGLVMLGILLFLGVLHLLAINTSGGTSTVLSSMFTIFLWVYVSSIIFGVSALIIQLLRWLTWSINTPGWRKKQMKKQKERFR